MRLHSLALTGAALFAVTHLARAQTISWDGGDIAGDTVALPSGIQGAIGRSCSGDFDRDGTVDAAYLIGGKIVVLRSPESWAAVQDTGITAADIESSGVVSGEAFPKIVYVNASGLHELSFDGVTFSSQTLVSGGAWANAKRLRIRTIDSPPGPGPVPFPRRVYVAYTQHQGAYGVTSREVQGALVTDRSYSVGELGGDFVLPAWDATGQPTIAMVCNTQLQIRRLDGTTVRNVANVGPRGDAIALVRTAGDAYDRVAWLRRIAGTSDQELFLAGSTTGDATVAITSSGTLAHALRTTDLTESLAAGPDANTELVLADASSFEPRLAWSSGAGSLYDLGSVIRPLDEDASDASANAAWPLAADFTLDGAVDLLAPAQGGTCFRLFEALQPSFAARAFWGDQVFYSLHASANPAPGVEGIDRLALEIRPWGLTNDSSITFDWLQVVVWVQPTAASTTLVPISNALYEISDPVLCPRLPMSTDDNQDGLVNSDDDHLIPVVSLVGSPSPDGLACDDMDRVFWIQVRGRAAPGAFSGSNGPWWNLFLGANTDTLCALKTGTTGFRGLADSDESDDLPCAMELTGGCEEGESAAPGGAWGPRPQRRLSGGTRRLIAPGGQPATTLPDPGPEVVHDTSADWGLFSL